MRRVIAFDYGQYTIAASTPILADGKLVSIDNLCLDREGNTVLPAEIVCQGELFSYFKASPEHFEDIIKGEKVEVKRRDIIKELLKNVMDNIKNCNDVIESTDQILLVVGYPPLTEWEYGENLKAYERLIREATGVAEVRSIPESRAAIMNALSDGKGYWFTESKSTVILDFGSFNDFSRSMYDMHAATEKRCQELGRKFDIRKIKRKENTNPFFLQGSRKEIFAEKTDFIISHGLLLAELFDEHQDEIVSNIKKKLIENNEASVSELKSIIKVNTGEKAYQMVREALTDWAASPEDESLEDLVCRMIEKFKANLPDISNANSVCVAAWSDNITAKIRSYLEDETQNIFGKTLGQKMKMSENEWKDDVAQRLLTIKIDTDKVTENIIRLSKQYVVWSFCYESMEIPGNPRILPVLGSNLEIDDEDRVKLRSAWIRNRVKKEEFLQMCDGAIDAALDSQITDDSVASDAEMIARRAYAIMTLNVDDSWICLKEEEIE